MAKFRQCDSVPPTEKSMVTRNLGTSNVISFRYVSVVNTTADQNSFNRRLFMVIKILVSAFRRKEYSFGLMEQKYFYAGSLFKSVLARVCYLY